MEEKLQHALALRNTDVNGAIRRLGDDEALYHQCLDMFLQDRTITDLNTAIEQRSWDDAFTAAHALKGLAGNMGFVPLMHATSQLLIMIRGGRMNEIGESMAFVNSQYRDIVDAIKMNTTYTQAEGV